MILRDFLHGYWCWELFKKGIDRPFKMMYIGSISLEMGMNHMGASVFMMEVEG